MRIVSRLSLAVVAVAVVLVAGCSGGKQAPVGRWQGTYQDSGVMVAARVEIAKNGDVRVSAPNAFMDFSAVPEDDRREIAARLSSGLAQSWPHVQPHPFEFDGRVFRNPGGVAPQLEWDSSTRHMTMYVYPGSKPTIRIDMAPVKEFGS